MRAPTRHAPCLLPALLDGLEKELLRAAPEELREALRETGRARESILQEIRSVLEEAADDPTIPVTPQPGGRGGLGIYRH